MNDFRLPDWIRHDRPNADLDADILEDFLAAEGETVAADVSRIIGEAMRSDRCNTERAYLSDQRRYVAAAAAAGEDPLRPSRPFWAKYITDYFATHKATTTHRHTYGIARLFFDRGLRSPIRTFFHRRLLRSLRRTREDETKRAPPLCGPDVPALLESYDCQSLRALRDYVICVIGCTRGFRSATIIGLLIEDIIFDDRGVLFALRNEKTARGSRPLPTGTPHSPDHRHCVPCSVRRLVELLAELGFDEGPLFRSINRWNQVSTTALVPKSITAILRNGLARVMGAKAAGYTGHSFRHGAVATARRKGWTDEEIMLVTMHRTKTGLEPYLMNVDPWYQSPERNILDGSFPEPPRPGQGWLHV